jgi:hypothetical protein
MAKKYFYFKGKGKWIRPDRPDQYGKWKHMMYPDAESLELFRELQLTKDNVQGIKNVLKKDDDGYNFSISRDQQKTIQGRVVGFAPPEIYDGSKKLEDGSYQPLRDVNIGNGSDIVSKVEYYTYNIPGPSGDKRKGSAIRWESSRVDNLVPFQGRTEFTEGEAKMAKGMDTVEPTQEGW